MTAQRRGHRTLAAVGASKRAVQEVLGHVKPDTTQVYTKMVNRLVSNPTAKLEEQLGR